MSAWTQTPTEPAPPRLVDRLIGPVVNLVGVVGGLGLTAGLAELITTGRAATAMALTGLSTVVTALALDPALGLLSWLALAPFSQAFNLSMGRGLPDLGINRVAASFLLILLIAQVAAGRRRLAHVTRIEVAAGLFVVAMLLSTPASRLGLVSAVQNVFDTVALPLLCLFYGRNLLAGERGLNRLATVLALVGAVLGLAAVREQLTNQAFLSPIPYRWAYGQYSIKVTSFFGAPAIMTFTLSMTIAPVFLAFVRARTMGARLFFAGAFAAIVAGLMLTYVRAGWLAAAASVLVLLVLAPQARRYVFLLVPVILTAALILASGSVDTRALAERLQTEGSISYRTAALEVGFQVAATAPILGLGLDNYSAAALAAGWRPVGALGLPVVAAHNLFIYVLTSAGLSGLLPLVALLGLSAWQLWRDWLAARGPGRDWPAAALAMMVGWGLFANTFDALGAQYANMLFFTVLGAVLGAGQEARA